MSNDPPAFFTKRKLSAEMFPVSCQSCRKCFPDETQKPTVTKSVEERLADSKSLLEAWDRLHGETRPRPGAHPLDRQPINEEKSLLSLDAIERLKQRSTVGDLFAYGPKKRKTKDCPCSGSE